MANPRLGRTHDWRLYAVFSTPYSVDRTEDVVANLNSDFKFVA
jgi:hypothetical protein